MIADARPDGGQVDGAPGEVPPDEDRPADAWAPNGPASSDGRRIDIDQAAWGNPSHAEPLWPARLAVLGIMALYITLPDRLTIGPSWLPPALELCLVVPLTLMAPIRHKRESMVERFLAQGLIGLVNLVNIATLGLLIDSLLHDRTSLHIKAGNSQFLLQVGAQVWITNVLCFALAYWELDRGGPMRRRRLIHNPPDFLFPQMTTPSCAPSGWAPSFLDYLYISFTNSTAFSPTDTMPLTAPAKLLMMVQSIASLLTIALVTARAVNILS